MMKIKGFTLIELLIVISIIALLMAILLPALNKARTKAKSLACQNNQKQIYLAWQCYFNDNDDFFLKGNNTNHTFAGWQGVGGYSPLRPLNIYLSLPANNTQRSQHGIILCPADSGGIFSRPSSQKAIDYFGNSYETNFIIVGPQQLWTFDPLTRELFTAVNKNISSLKRDAVSCPSALVFFGDNNWFSHFEYNKPPGKAWHNNSNIYNLAFMDGHVKPTAIQKNIWLNNDYRILPFKSLDALARKVQHTDL